MKLIHRIVYPWTEQKTYGLLAILLGLVILPTEAAGAALLIIPLGMSQFVDPHRYDEDDDY
jgi:hypothetical protein